ncbi:hypothetical protein ACTOWA_02765 [Herbaspirillum seropedicae]|uniref:hypothetical protein n=1 Tax=Herbaspirillum seropedicae TaxID=964 RepID=UPI003F8D7071
MDSKDEVDNLSELLIKKAERFRKKWEEEVSAGAYRQFSIPLTRGDSRTVYLLSEKSHAAKEFSFKYKGFKKRIDKDVDNLKNKAPNYAKAIDLLFPFFEENCFGVEVRKYVARSQGPITKKQAVNFLRRIGAECPANAVSFYLRSRSGYRYKLIVQTKNGKKEFPLRSWNVIVTGRELGENFAPSKAKKIPEQKGAKAWREEREFQFLGKKGKRFLYCKIK